MAQYKVTYGGCGHSGQVDLFGAMTERDRKLAYFAKSGLCASCYGTSRDTERAADIERQATELIAKGRQQVGDDAVMMASLESQIAAAPTGHYLLPVARRALEILKGGN